MADDINRLSLLAPISDPLDRFDPKGVQTKPCREIDNNIEWCKPEEAEFWSVYLRFDAKHPANAGFNGVECAGDFPTQAIAVVFAQCMTNTLVMVHEHKERSNGT